jgi:hypothetical protein
MDLEAKKSPVDVSSDSPADIDVVESQTLSRRKAWLKKAAAWGVETRGITPVPLEERTDPRFINVFFVWFTMSTNLLPYVSLRLRLEGSWIADN